MRGEKLHQAVRRLVCVVGSQGGGDLTDGQLLERFSAYRDEVAFAALVRRHAPLVLGVCRRLLRDPHDADDAFQATFLVLVRKLGTLDHRRPIGNWLYGVAYRVALKARARRAAGVNRLMTRSVSIAPSTSEQTDDSPHPDIRPILDEELNRLPKKYRIALVMCYLQGKTHAQAAKELAWPTGSMSKRLAKGKELLRERLTRRGVALSSAALGTGFAESAAAAGSGSALIVSTTEAAVAYAAGKYTAAAVSASAAILAKGALNAMWMTKVKTIAAAILAGVVLSGGTGVAAYRVWANGEATDKKGPALLPAAKAAEQPVNTAAETLQNAETDEDKVQGTWTVVWAESGSPEPREREAQEKRLQNTKVIFAGDELEFRHVDPKQRAIGDRARFRLAPFTSPRTIAITPIDKPGELSLHGIYAW